MLNAPLGRPAFLGKKLFSCLIMLLSVFIFSCVQSVPYRKTDDQPWWEAEGVRILVARSNTLYRQHPPTREQIREIKEAGFNVYGARWNRLEYEEVTNTLRMCAAEGIHYAPWIRGSLANDDDDDEKKLVWENGAVQSLYGPLAPELWDYLKERTAFYAGLSVEWPLVGLMLDFEAYAENKQLNLYYLSYDVYSLRLYSEYAGVAGPPAGLKSTEAVEWVRSRPESDWAGYEEWFTAQFKAKAAELRALADGHNPRFLFMVYAGSGLVADIAAGQWSTEKAPFVFLGVDYGKPSTLLSERMSLAAIEHRTAQRRELLDRREDFNILLLGGTLPGYMGSDPEFSAKKAAILSRDGDGYWVWYAMNYTPEEHREYFRWYRKANDDILSGSFSIADMPRRNPEPLQPEAPLRTSDLPAVGVYGGMTLKNELRSTGEHEIFSIESLEADYLVNFDIIVMQNFNVSLPYGSPVHEVLREYAREGGGVFITHNTLRYMESPFPEIGKHARPRYNVTLLNQVLDRRMFVSRTAGILPEELVRVNFEAGFMDHIIFARGPLGKVLVENYFKEPVYVAGEFGEGRVAFSGCHFAYRPGHLAGAEREILFSIIRWLENR